jgi:hypothetical protein
MGFERDVRIRSEREDNLVSLPGGFQQLFTQQANGIDLNNDLSIKVGTRTITEILMRGPAEAVRAPVNAPTITVD